MLIDPWNINGQQCFSLTCEGEWEKGRRKENRRGGGNRNLYLMVVFYKKENNVNPQLQYRNSKLIIFTNSIKFARFVRLAQEGLACNCDCNHR